MRWDWYQATVAEDPKVLIDAVLAQVAEGGEVKMGRGKHNYHHSATVDDRKGNRAALVLFGGPNGNPNITASGEACDEFVPMFRRTWPEHRPTCLHAAQDFGDADAFDRVEAVCKSVTAEHRVKGLSLVPDDPADGRTYTMGSFKSMVYGRLYDKAAERRKALPPELHGEIPEHLTRLEVVCRPPREWRDAAASWEPQHVFAAADWTQAIADAAMGLQLERVMRRCGRVSDFERSYRAMLGQYGRTFSRLLADCGSWAAVGCQLGEDLARIEAARRRR